MLVVLRPKEDKNVCSETTDFFYYHDDAGSKFISLRVPAEFSVMTAEPETNTIPPMLKELLAEQFNRQVFFGKLQPFPECLSRAARMNTVGP